MSGQGISLDFGFVVQRSQDYSCLCRLSRLHGFKVMSLRSMSAVILVETLGTVSPLLISSFMLTLGLILLALLPPLVPDSFLGFANIMRNLLSDLETESVTEAHHVAFDKTMLDLPLTAWAP